MDDEIGTSLSVSKRLDALEEMLSEVLEHLACWPDSPCPRAGE